MTLRLSAPPDEEATTLVEDALATLTFDHVARLATIFPGVDPRMAATALLIDAIE